MRLIEIESSNDTNNQYVYAKNIKKAISNAFKKGNILNYDYETLKYRDIFYDEIEEIHNVGLILQNGEITNDYEKIEEALGMIRRNIKNRWLDEHHLEFNFNEEA